ncbi:quaternary ammonium compound efflux SMR transporter SugE [Marinomonas epiphytica]
MSWGILVIAGLLEVVWAIGLKYTDGFSRFWPSTVTVIAMAISLFLLSVALRTLPIGTAYAVWVGIGMIGTAIVGIIVFNEPINLIKSISLLLLLSGIVGLKLA